MPRQLRIEYEGAIYNVMSRGVRWSRFSDQQKPKISYGMWVSFDFYFLIWNASTSVCKGIPIFLLWSVRPGWPRSVAERPARACSGREKNRTPGGGRFLPVIFMLPFSLPLFLSTGGDLFRKHVPEFGCPNSDGGARCCSVGSTSEFRPPAPQLSNSL